MVSLPRDAIHRSAYAAVARAGLIAVAVFAGGGLDRPTPRGAHTQGQAQPPADAHQSNASGKDRGTDATPIVVKIATTREQQRTADEEAKERQGDAERGWWGVWLTTILTIATVALGVFTFLLWWSTKKAVVDANEGVRIANDTLEHARQTAIIQTRAYIAPQKASIVISENRIGATVWIKNVGDTPASNLNCAAAMSVGPWPQSSAIRIGVMHLPGSVPPHSMELWPTDDVVVQATSTFLSPAERAAIELEISALYLFGVIYYTDAFEGKVTTYFTRHRTGKGWLSGDSFSVSPMGNETTYQAKET